MSKYADYDRISLTYDRTRRAIGATALLDALGSIRSRAPEIVVLDAGCGTGNYLIELQDPHTRVVGCDLSRGMLRQAHKKLLGATHAEGSLVQCDLTALPFAPSSFDAVACNQVIHHLDQPGTGFVNHKRFFVNARRVLKPDGVLILSTISHAQLHDGVWWGRLIAPAVKRMTPRFADLAELETLLRQCGFQVVDTRVPLDVIIQENGYFDHNSLRDEGFRNGDSHFSLLTGAELKAILDEIDRLERAGEISGYIQQRDRLRQRIGQVTFVVAEAIDAS